ncbi:MAG TPA: ATP synthase F1 subunit delta [Lachnospiraceae bacterium]|nr:ATP synthase F1 subunit delta [Lachnospiraceae bacterium]
MTTETSLYGQSLYDLAAEEGLSEEILDEMEAVEKIFKENPDYITLLLEPSVPRRERLGLLEEAFGDQIHPYLKNFLMILLENSLLRGFSACCRTYRASYNKDHGIEEAIVTSAVALSDEQIRSLKAKLEKMSGKTVLLTQKVDSSVLGGLRVEIGGKLLDGTVMGRLADLRKKVSETVL